MKNKLISLIIVIILVSCNGVKKTSKSDIAFKNDVKTEVKSDTEVNESGKTVDKTTVKTDSTALKTLALIEKLTADWETRLKTYDTSKPVDPGTGTPPLASEMIMSNKQTKDRNLTQTVKNQTAKTENRNIESDYRLLIKQAVDSAMSANSKLIDKSTTSEKPPDTGWKWLLAGMAISLLVWLIYHYKWWKFVSF